MKGITKLVFATMLITILQGCTAGGVPPQAPAVADPNASGQNMDYMFRSPSYQLNHIGR